MSVFADLLAWLGEHFPLVIIGCVELLFAVVLLGVLPRRAHRTAAPSVRSDMGRLLLEELAVQKNEICLVMDRAQLLPIYAEGDPAAMLGVTLAQLQEDITRLLSQLKDPEAGSRFWADYRRWDGKSDLSADLEMPDGQWVQVSVQRCHSPGYDLFIFRRVTAQRQKEAAYEERLRQAEEASQFKTSFLFRMSHEIRTPMNGITGMLTLAESKLEPDHPAMQYLDRADELTGHLLSLINDILDMSRIEAGKVELESAPFSLRTLGGKLYDMFSKTLDAKGVDYHVNFEEMDADWVIGDELRISQVVINFLSNAVKFTSEGEVTVTFRQMLLHNDTLDLMIRVHDTGIGMKPEFISRIFRPFEQEDASTTRRFGGTGLGMAISDQLVKLMGGQIVVESMPGKGSDFSVFLSLPITSAPAGTAEAEGDTAVSPSAGSHAYRLLMAEDNEINAMISVELLAQRGASVDVAQDGQAAVEQFLARPAGYYDAILMDIQMPVMDGRAAARAIRALDRPDAATVPILALSADAFVEDERLSREAGMNGHLSKPIDFDALWRVLEKLVVRKERSDL